LYLTSQQQPPSHGLNEDFVNMHEWRTLSFTALTSPDALAKRKMETNGKSLSQDCSMKPVQ
ncbi:hypothetical protein CHARACLAT_010399, partial [Characodon lateralis]|nr:hypothetical protein [Characodon lateralis]